MMRVISATAQMLHVARPGLGEAIGAMTFAHRTQAGLHRLLWKKDTRTEMATSGIATSKLLP